MKNHSVHNLKVSQCYVFVSQRQSDGSRCQSSPFYHSSYQVEMKQSMFLIFSLNCNQHV